MTTQTASPVIVHAVRIIGTDFVEYSAYSLGDVTDAHGYRDFSTIQSFNGRYYGRIGTRRISAEIEAMAGGSPERVAAAHAHSAAEYAQAYAAIEAAFPETVNGRHVMGTISVTVRQ